MVPLFEINLTLTPKLFRALRKLNRHIVLRMRVLKAAGAAAVALGICAVLLRLWPLVLAAALLLVMTGLLAAMWIQLPFLSGSQQAVSVNCRFYSQELTMTDYFGKHTFLYTSFERMRAGDGWLLLYLAGEERMLALPDTAFVVGSREELLAFLQKKGIPLCTEEEKQMR